MNYATQSITKQEEETFMLYSITECTHPPRFVFRDSERYEHCTLCALIDISSRFYKLADRVTTLEKQLLELVNIVVFMTKPL